MRRPNALPPHLVARMHARRPPFVRPGWDNDGKFFGALMAVAAVMVMVVRAVWRRRN